MLKLFKWIYDLGVRNERRRVRLMIARFRDFKPIPPMDDFGDEKELSYEIKRNYRMRLDLWIAVNDELAKLTREDDPDRSLADDGEDWL